jgi:hypothetical protein
MQQTSKTLEQMLEEETEALLERPLTARCEFISRNNYCKEYHGLCKVFSNKHLGGCEFYKPLKQGVYPYNCDCSQCYHERSR